MPAPLAALWGGVFAAAAYALLAGWGVPAQRTLWMLATLALLRSAGVRWPQPLVLMAAVVVVTLFDPWALMQPGFWLSFVAVGLLIASEPVSGGAAAPAALSRAQRLTATLRAGLRTQAVASIGLAPLSMIFFQQVSLVGFVANLLAIPLVTLVIVPLTLLGIVFHPLWAAASALVQALVWALSWMGGWPFGLWTAAAASAWGMASGLLGGALLILPLPWRLRLLGLPLLLPLLAPVVERPAQGDFELLAADIGQGTALLVRTRGHLLVYDAGPKYSPQADAAQRVLLPLLRARGEQHVDLLMLSHSDIDHVGGAATLLAHSEVRALASSLPHTHALLAGGPPHRRCMAGQSWDWDGVRFEVLHPAPTDYALALKPNALSCVVRVQGQGGRSLLLTGDIEAAQEAALVARLGQRAAQPGAAGAAPWQQDLVHTSLHRGRGTGHGTGAGGLPQPFRTPCARGRGALSCTRCRASAQRRMWCLALGRAGRRTLRARAGTAILASSRERRAGRGALRSGRDSRCGDGPRGSRLRPV